MTNAAASPALDRLAELLRQAEAKTRVQELTGLIRKAAEPLRGAGDRLEQAERRARDIRPARLRELEQIDIDDIRLKELVRKTAQNRALLVADEQREADRLSEAARVELEARRKTAQTEVSSMNRELDDARREVRILLERYRAVRGEMERLLPEEDGFQEEDAAAQRAESFFPEYQIRAFSREIDDSSAHYGTLDRREQYAQMMIWIGRLRKFQMADPSEEERDLLEQIFRKLVTLSKTYEPGYIEAFHRQYQADWDVYVAEAQERLRLASEDARRDRSGGDRDRGEPRRRLDFESQRPHARRAAQAGLDAIRGVIARHGFELASTGAEEFRNTLIRVVESYGPLDGALIDLISPYRELCVGPELQSLRAYLDQLAMGGRERDDDFDDDDE
ncbi:MAG: hypothetical protein U0800_17610 [Isosphaeraceae bacterium]